MEQGSEVARLMRQITLEYESAELGLTGMAITAKHEFITARMEHGGARILQLIAEGKHAEAQALMNTENWGMEEDKETRQNGIKEDNKRILLMRWRRKPCSARRRSMQ